MSTLLLLLALLLPVAIGAFGGYMIGRLDAQEKREQARWAAWDAAIEVSHNDAPYDAAAWRVYHAAFPKEED